MAMSNTSTHSTTVQPATDSTIVKPAPQGSVKDSGRVHVGGGMMRY
jgi:hypothetical protein